MALVNAFAYTLIEVKICMTRELCQPVYRGFEEYKKPFRITALKWFGILPAFQPHKSVRRVNLRACKTRNHYVGMGR